jgi:hypothetical protein
MIPVFLPERLSKIYNHRLPAIYSNCDPHSLDQSVCVRSWHRQYVGMLVSVEGQP